MLTLALAALTLVSITEPGVVAHQTDASFPAEQLEQLVAPIALHPDSLLTQILMAATYPLEVVQAHRWVQKDPKRTGPKLEEALKDQDWDPSVKSLCGFPTVLQQMNDNLDWTQDLGDAFLAQKAELLEAVQAMRKKALEAGQLKTTSEQKVTQDEQIIVIASADPEVVYVPTYSPVVVYGGWYYPSWYYPAWYYPPPPGYGAVVFTAGVIWGAAMWGHCDWHHGDIDIDINHYNQFNKNTNINVERNKLAGASGSKAQWNHDPAHRKGVNYRSPETAQKFGGAPGASRVPRDQARGFERAAPATVERPATRDPGGRSAPRTAPTRPGNGNGSALSRPVSPSLDRSASQRGAASRGTNLPRGAGRRH